MIQDISPYKLVNTWKNEKITPEDSVLVFSDSKVLCRLQNDDLIFPQAKDFSSESSFTYLFTVKDNEKFNRRYFLLQNKDGTKTIPSGFEFTEVRQIKDTEIDHMYKVFVIMTAKHLNDWYRDNQFCGRCGKKTVHSQLERAMVCTECKNTFYPRIMPAVIVGILNGEKILLTKYNRKGYTNYALVAGFAEIGETLEQTVEREVMEETGLKVKNIRYYKSQPWGLANDILVGYYCDVDGDTTIHMDQNELKLAEWVERKDVILQPTKVSMTNEMMMKFKNGEI